MTTPGDRPDPAGPVVTALQAPRVRGMRGALRVVGARLRFLVVFAAVFAVIGGWETIRAYWSRLVNGPTREAAISSDTEYFCPMDPGVISDWPSKCPVCNMTLVRRKRGETAALPEGVMARMQITPYRLWLGGIRTATADYAPLARTFELPGMVADDQSGRARVEAEVFARELPWIAPGQTVEVVPMDEDGRPPTPGHIRELPRSVAAGAVGKVVVALDGKADPLRPGEPVRVRVACPVERIDPFRDQPTVPPRLAPGEPRRLFACMEHADVVRDAAGRCPRDGLELMAHPLRDDQRVRWWCPMHPSVVADRPGATCSVCGGMALVPRVVSYRPAGRVLAIPASAAIGDGARAVVYVERGPGMFDAKAVMLGPRCGAAVPVASGLEPGDRVVAQGGFLLDAETRLDPSLATGYFGAGEAAASARPTAAKPESAEDEWLRGLAEADRPRAIRQKTCPVTGKPLGSMGVPPKLTVRGRDVFLCCDGCAGAVESDPERYLAKLPREAAERRP
jgi:hypothetical protein